MEMRHRERQTQNGAFPDLNLETHDGRWVCGRAARHNDVCWRYSLTIGEIYVGDMLFEPRDSRTIELREIKIQAGYRGLGIGTGVLRSIICVWKHLGFTSVEGIIVAETRDAKDRLLIWYQRFGAEVTREEDPDNPRYAGALRIVL